MSTAEQSPQPSWIPRDTFGARLALVRQHMAWNVKEAALACGISAANWRKWEHGRNPQKLHEAASLIAERTGCDYRWLVMGSAGGLTLPAEYQQPDLELIQGGGKTARLPQQRQLEPFASLKLVRGE